VNDIVLRIFTEGILPIIITGLGVLGGQVLFKLKTKINNDNIKLALDQLARVTKTVVAQLNQTVVAEIRLHTADGNLTPTDMREIKAKAVNLIKSQMQNEFLELLARNTIDVEGLIESTIEASVYELKKVGCNISTAPIC
jgi:hypothetical protein